MASHDEMAAAANSIDLQVIPFLVISFGLSLARVMMMGMVGALVGGRIIFLMRDVMLW
jgi:hypothetical protein